MEAPVVYVINKDGKPLMPTKRYKKVRLWLKNKQARVVHRKPFTIQLLFETGSYTDSLRIGIDPGYSYVGLSVLSSKKEYFSGKVELRTNIPSLMQEKKMYRVNRRSRNTRYRKARFLNRKKNLVLAPSIHQKVESHLRSIKFLQSILPIKNITIEVNSFDPHKLKNPEIQGTEYQQGEQYGWENTRAYILARDQHTCYFKDKCSKQLNVEHVIQLVNGGSNAPFNLITLCRRHSKLRQQGKIILGEIKVPSFKEATAMNIVRSQLLQKMPEAQVTYGYLTKIKREQLNLEKSHSNDAFLIAGGSRQTRCPTIQMAFKRKNNRCLQLNRKGFKPSIRRERYKIQPKDLVRWNHRLYRTVGIQNYGTYLKMTDGIETLVKSVKQVQIVFHEKSLYVT